MPRLTCEQARIYLQEIQEDVMKLKKEIDIYTETGNEEKKLVIDVKIGSLKLRTQALKEWVAPFKEAKQILGKDFLGPEAILKTWGVELEAKDIPPIPFSLEDLERAKELGQFLIYRIPLTMQDMESKTKEPVFREDWFKQEDFYTKDTSKPGWALVSKEVIPDSINKNYLEQIQRIIAHLDNDIFRVQSIPEPYASAIQTFDEQKDELADLIQSDWEEATKRLSELQITKLTRQSAADAIHDLLVYKQNNDERLLENVYTWTNTRGSTGRLVDVGNLRPVGLSVGSSEPAHAIGSLGVVFSRSQ